MDHLTLAQPASIARIQLTRFVQLRCFFDEEGALNLQIWRCPRDGDPTAPESYSWTRAQLRIPAGALPELKRVIDRGAA